MAIWWGTPVEAQSALQRLQREGFLSPAELVTARKRLSAMSEAALEVMPTELVRALASSALEQYELRAADALQLAAALVLCHEHPRNRAFVCFDAKLAIAAEAAGFTVLPAR
jgi:predicted nucleic acid-binding protein